MLPAALSNEKCSLVPGEERLAVSVELEFDGARVVRAADGLPAGFMPAALLRYLVPVGLIFLLNGAFPFLGFLFLFVDYGFMFREDRRCLHDLIAGTKVVKV